MSKLNELQRQTIAAMPDAIADELLVQEAQKKMVAKLKKTRAKGRGGWHGVTCKNSDLWLMLQNQMLNGRDPVDIMNIAAMIAVRKDLYREKA